MFEGIYLVLEEVILEEVILWIDVSVGWCNVLICFEYIFNNVANLFLNQ